MNELQKPITAADVRALREKTGCTMWEAKNILVRQRNLETLIELRKTGSLEEKVNFLLDQAIQYINK